MTPPVQGSLMLIDQFSRIIHNQNTMGNIGQMQCHQRQSKAKRAVIEWPKFDQISNQKVPMGRLRGGDRGARMPRTCFSSMRGSNDGPLRVSPNAAVKGSTVVYSASIPIRGPDQPLFYAVVDNKTMPAPKTKKKKKKHYPPLA
jgi:hypothetical protein